jgi:hypothetical protein
LTSRAPDRHRDRHNDSGDPAKGGDIGALDEDMRRICVIGEPPPEESRRLIDRPPENFEPGTAELGLVGKAPSDPFRRGPHEGEHDGADKEHLPPKDLGRVHSDGRPEPIGRSRQIQVARRQAAG